jgi:hypothetical protein
LVFRIHPGHPDREHVALQHLIVIQRAAVGAIGAKLCADLGPVPAGVRLDQAGVDDACRTAETEQHRIGTTADFDPIDHIAVHRDVRQEVVTRRIGAQQAAHAGAGRRFGHRIIIDTAEIDRAGEISARATHFGAHREREQGREVRRIDVLHEILRRDRD